MENKELQQVMNYVRDLGAEMLRSLERGTQATLSLRDSKQYELGTETNDLLKKLLKVEAPDYSVYLKDNTKAIKELSKAQAESSKAVISAVKSIKLNIPPFPEQKPPIIDFKGITTPFKDLISLVKDLPKKFGSLLDSFGTKTRPVYVVQVDENGKVINEKEAQTIVRAGGVVRTVSIANKAGIEINPATDEKLDQVIDAVDSLSPAQILKKTIDLSSSDVILAPALGKKLKIHSLKFTLTADITSIAFNFGVGSNFEKFLNCKGGGLYGNNMHPNFLLGGTNEELKLTLVGSATVSVNVDYQEIN